MKKRSIVNLTHFVRGVNQAHPQLEYMLRPVKEHLRLMKEYNLSLTVLLQYDALIDSNFTDLLKENQEERLEIGLWLEIPRILAEKSNVKWNGQDEWTWDWHTYSSYLIGYTPKERMAMVDEAMETFRKIFGCYPDSVGCWIIDAKTLKYLKEKYNVKAACICRDQWGTDGMSLWGGYDSIYYPSENNMLCPGDEENQINLPVIRMLVNDPMYNFDIDYTRSRLPELEGAEFFTLEPVFPHCGGNEEWVKWIFSVQSNSATAPYSYAQIDQENGFGWEKMGKGLEMQCKYLKTLIDEGLFESVNVRDTGKWFSENFDVTPANTVAALTDHKHKGRQSVWYYSKNYRANVFSENGKLWFRDLRKFCSEVEELYLTETCKQHGCRYTNPPVLDGLLFSDANVRAGIYPVKKTEKGYEDMIVNAPDFEKFGNVLKFGFDGFAVDCTEDMVCMELPENGAWELRFSKNAKIKVEIDGDTLRVTSDGTSSEQMEDINESWAESVSNTMTATVKLLKGKAEMGENKILLLPQDGKIQMDFK